MEEQQKKAIKNNKSNTEKKQTKTTKEKNSVTSTAKKEKTKTNINSKTNQNKKTSSNAKSENATKKSNNTKTKVNIESKEELQGSNEKLMTNKAQKIENTENNKIEKQATDIEDLSIEEKIKMIKQEVSDYSEKMKQIKQQMLKYQENFNAGKQNANNIIESTQQEYIIDNVKTNNLIQEKTEGSLKHENARKEKDYNQEPTKKFFEISIGLIISIIVIIGLIILNIKLGIHAYNVIKGSTEVQNESYNSSIQQHY